MDFLLLRRSRKHRLRRGLSRCGIIPNAFDYLYVIPQIQMYELDQGPAYFSFASIDWSIENSPKLLTGNFHDNDDNEKAVPTLSWWNLTGSKIISRNKFVSSGLKDKCQGAEAINGKIILRCSSGDSNYRGLYIGNPNNFKKHSWPYGCEDLHYSLTSGNLWCLTEYESNRYVFAVKASDYL